MGSNFQFPLVLKAIGKNIKWGRGEWELIIRERKSRIKKWE